MTVRSELRLADVGQPDLQVVNGDGVAIGYGEIKQPGTAARFAEVLESEQAPGGAAAAPPGAAAHRWIGPGRPPAPVRTNPVRGRRTNGGRGHRTANEGTPSSPTPVL